MNHRNRSNRRHRLLDAAGRHCPLSLLTTTVRVLFIAAACLVATTVQADSWAPPQTEVYVSASGDWRLTVDPRPIVNQLKYFEDKVADRPNAGGLPGNKRTSALGTMEHRIKNQWRVAWKAPLVNETAPVQALVSERGQAVTLDNWHSVGYGKDAVVFYDERGKGIRALGLQDFLPKEYIDALPRSVSSIDWRANPVISADGLQLDIPVVVPRPGDGDDNKEYVVVRFSLATGKHVPDQRQTWKDALQSAHAANEAHRAQLEVEKIRFISPLLAPDTDANLAWHNYLEEAFFRIDPDWNDEYPAKTIVRPPHDQDYSRSVGWVREALTDRRHSTGVTMLASPSQDALVDVLAQEAAKVSNGTRSGVRIYVVADASHFAAAQKALAHTGATIIQIDPAKPIPQRPERLERYLSHDPTKD